MGPVPQLAGAVRCRLGRVMGTTDILRKTDTTARAGYLRRVTRELDIPLIVDEVQSGGGRTGTWFAFEQHGIVPDVIVASKAIGAMGMPIAIVLHHERLDAFAPGSHTGTFRGNQLAFAAGVAATRIVKRDGILEHVRELGEYSVRALAALASGYEIVGEVRGSGLMLGIELVDTAGEPNSQGAAEVQRAEIGTPRSPTDEEKLGDDLAPARALLAADAQEQALQAGRALDLHAALEEAFAACVDAVRRKR